MITATFRGTGQLNGPININKTIEIDDVTAKNLGGQNRDDVKKAILSVHFPGVKINPRQIGVEIKRGHSKKEDYNDLTGFLKSNSPKKTFSFTNILTWIIFFPIKLAWWILKSIWHNDHMASKWR